jgi:hypothetical protein
MLPKLKITLSLFSITILLLGLRIEVVAQPVLSNIPRLGSCGNFANWTVVFRRDLNVMAHLLLASFGVDDFDKIANVRLAFWRQGDCSEYAV